MKEKEKRTTTNFICLKAPPGSSWKMMLFFKHYSSHNNGFFYPFNTQTFKKLAEGISNMFSYYMQVGNKGT